jgi:hypothetical protein
MGIQIHPFRILSLALQMEEALHLYLRHKVCSVLCSSPSEGALIQRNSLLVLVVFVLEPRLYLEMAFLGMASPENFRPYRGLVEA